MQEYEELVGELIELGVSANPVYPYACCIVDPCGQILVTAACAGHISPLYSAEGLALHMLASHYRCDLSQQLTMVTTAEPESGGMTALCWARRGSGINVTRIIYGASREKLQQLWQYDYNSFSAAEMIDRLQDNEQPRPELIGPTLEEDCLEAFNEGKALYDQAETPVLSMDLDDYWMAGDWIMED